MLYVALPVLTLCSIVAAFFGYGLKPPGYIPPPSPSPPVTGTVLMVDCEGKRKALGRFVGEPQITREFTAWTDDKGSVVRTRGFILFVKDKEK